MATNDTNDGLNLEDEDRLPWLEAADSYDEEEAVSPGRLLMLVLGGLVLIGAVLGGLWWMQGGGDRSQGELIAAQEGPYKQVPADDGAKQFEGEGDASFAASEGAEPSGKLDPGKMPEEPAVPVAKPVTPPPAVKTPPPADKAEMVKGPAPVAKAPVVASKAPPPKAIPVKAAPPAAKPVPTKAAPPATSPAAGGSVIQLGAFSSEESAAKAWISLSKRFAYLGGLSKSVAPASVNGSTVYRLRAVTASGAAANDICGKLRVAGENCAVVR
jgi:hypothetical protein